MANMKNPFWTRDELILALNLYINAGRKYLEADDERVVNLSNFLGTLPIHPKETRTHKFRNPHGIAMKLGNFSALDPDYKGKGSH